MALAASHRRSGHLKEVGDGRWIVRASLGKDAEGQRLRYNKLVIGKKADAQRHLASVLQQADQGVKAVLTRQTLGEWTQEWLTKWCVSVAPRTKADYASLLARLFRYEPQLGGRRIAELSSSELQGAIHRLHARGLGNRSLQMYRGVLRVSLNRALKIGKVSRNVAALVEIPRGLRAERIFLTPDQAQRLLSLSESGENRFGALFALLLLTGLRPGEAVGLKWADVDGASLRVRRSMVSVPGELAFLDETKTRRSRSVALGERAVRVLERHRKEQVLQRLQLGSAYKDASLVFANETGGLLSLQNISSRYYKPLLVQAGLPDLRLYDLRHAHATLLLAAGEHPKVVQERLGHSTIALTLDTYSHVVPGMQERAAERLDALLTPVEGARSA